jgi:hypothetical protein
LSEDYPRSSRVTLPLIQEVQTIQFWQSVTVAELEIVRLRL